MKSVEYIYCHVRERGAAKQLHALSLRRRRDSTPVPPSHDTLPQWELFFTRYAELPQGRYQTPNRYWQEYYAMGLKPHRPFQPE